MQKSIQQRQLCLLWWLTWNIDIFGTAHFLSFHSTLQVPRPKHFMADMDINESYRGAVTPKISWKLVPRPWGQSIGGNDMEDCFPRIFLQGTRKHIPPNGKAGKSLTQKWLGRGLRITGIIWKTKPRCWLFHHPFVENMLARPSN